jgi:hypothetical protein
MKKAGFILIALIGFLLFIASCAISPVLALEHFWGNDISYEVHFYQWQPDNRYLYISYSEGYFFKGSREYVDYSFDRQTGRFDRLDKPFSPPNSTGSRGSYRYDSKAISPDGRWQASARCIGYPPEGWRTTDSYYVEGNKIPCSRFDFIIYDGLSWKPVFELTEADFILDKTYYHPRRPAYLPYLLFASIFLPPLLALPYMNQDRQTSFCSASFFNYIIIFVSWSVLACSVIYYFVAFIR